MFLAEYLIFEDLLFVCLIYPSGHTSVCRLLLDAGADAKATMNGITPTQLAQDMGHTDILLLLSRKQIEDEDMES